jgi:hypothetical protein
MLDEFRALLMARDTSIVTTNRLPTDPRIAAKLRSRRRLRVLLAFAVVSLGLYVFIRLDRSAAERLGPVAEVIYNLFNGTPGDSPPLTPAARHFAADIRAMGGHPSVSVTSRGYFGIIGQAESLHASFDGPKFDDAALARLATQYGDRIDSLAIEYTGVTDAGLSNLSKFTSLTRLAIRNEPGRPGAPVGPGRITDAALVHLEGLARLSSLHLGGLPVTDDGLCSIAGLQGLITLQVVDAKARGDFLAGLSSLPRLAILYLDGCDVNEEKLAALSNATSLSLLSLRGVPLSGDALRHLKAIPRLRTLNIAECGFPGESLAALKQSKPGLKIEMQ